jgi:uncharacterized DUF497 family protein
VKFEWDRSKSESNREKHGISFESARELWDGPILDAQSHYPQESRRIAIGKIGGKHWTAIFTLRGGNIRLISVRRSRAQEREAYDEKEHDSRKS